MGGGLLLLLLVWGFGGEGEVEVDIVGLGRVFVVGGKEFEGGFGRRRGEVMDVVVVEEEGCESWLEGEAW